jgi:hypothetical protein
MARLATYIMLIGFAWTQFYNTVVISAYELNKVEFIQEFCENKEAPELQCNGKCHHSKQMAKSESTNHQSEPPTLLPELELFVYEVNENLDFSSNNKNTTRSYRAIYTFEYLKNIDPPPRVIV